MYYVLVIHQGFPAEPPADFKCKDKFLFVSVLADGELESKDVKEIVGFFFIKKKRVCILIPILFMPVESSGSS